MDKTGNFKVMVWRSVSLHGGNGSPANQYMFFDGMNIEPWIEKGDTSEIRWHAPDCSIRYPIHDGMYMRFPANLDYLISGKKYISKIYSAKDELLMELETNPTARTSLCPLGQGKYLINTGSPLYLWKDGQLTELMRGCYNFRLRRMNHLEKWKQAGGF